MTTILLVRHGQSQANLQNLFAGHSDFELTALGQQQAAKTAEYIGTHFDVSAVYASDLRRAFATGQAIADQLALPITPHPGLREIYAGEWEGMPFERLKTDYPQQWDHWINDFARVQCPGGESTVQLQQRVVAAVREIACKHKGQTVVLATHATPVRILMNECLDPSMQRISEVEWVSNASVTVLTYDRGQLQLIQSDLNGHLQEMQTGFADVMK